MHICMNEIIPLLMIYDLLKTHNSVLSYLVFKQ